MPLKLRDLRVDVSIHAPARGATDPVVRIERPSCGFNPRPRAGGDSRPVRPAVCAAVFQSTPPRGGRHRYSANLWPCQSFNPRPRAGGDQRQWATMSWAASFNPRPRAGGDAVDGPEVRQVCLFQSTPPRGGRLCSTITLDMGQRGFNPRPRAGGDRSLKPCNSPAEVSIHAPARGATTLLARPWFLLRVRRMPCQCYAGTFQSTPPRGGRSSVPSGFNPRPRAGGDIRMPCQCQPYVSIHAPARGRHDRSNP